MTTIGNYKIDFHAPVRPGERRAHGFPADVCTLEIHPRDDADQLDRLCDAAYRALPVDGDILAVFLGDADISASVSSDALMPIGETEPPIYRLAEPSKLCGVFAATREAIAIMRVPIPSVQGIVSAWLPRARPWWRLSRLTAIGRLASLHATFGHLAVFAPSEMSLELIGGRDSLVQAMQRLQQDQGPKGRLKDV